MDLVSVIRLKYWLRFTLSTPITFERLQSSAPLLPIFFVLKKQISPGGLHFLFPHFCFSLCTLFKDWRMSQSPETANSAMLFQRWAYLLKMNYQEDLCKMRPSHFHKRQRGASYHKSYDLFYGFIYLFYSSKTFKTVTSGVQIHKHKSKTLEMQTLQEWELAKHKDWNAILWRMGVQTNTLFITMIRLGKRSPEEGSLLGIQKRY